MHYSPERVDIPGAVLFHPVEIVIQTLVLPFVTVIVLGLDPLAAAIVGYLVPCYGMFQPWNFRTPQWHSTANAGSKATRHGALA